jgi:hypothetical protein
MKLAQSSMSDEENLFKSICVGDMKKKLADTKVNYFKQDIVDVHITGPFHHAGKSHWVVNFRHHRPVHPCPLRCCHRHTPHALVVCRRPPSWSCGCLIGAPCQPPPAFVDPVAG